MLNILPYIIGIFLVIRTSIARFDGLREFCTNVQLMHSQCNSFEESSSSHDVTKIRGKAGPRGQKGEKGSTGRIDNERLDAAVSRNIKGIVSQLNTKIEQCQSMIDQYAVELENVKKNVERLRGKDCSKFAARTFENGMERRGILDLYVSGRKTDVYCDLETDGGRWTVIQRRMDGSVDFYRNYSDYVRGFGNLSTEFWIGLENIHDIVHSRTFELRIDMQDWDGVKKYAKYKKFSVASSEEEYMLTVSSYSGTAGDSLLSHNGRKFSTKDHDVDGSEDANCAQLYLGSWWYESCHNSNLNGKYFSGGTTASYANGVIWRSWKGYHYSLKFVEMKIRPVVE